MFSKCKNDTDLLYHHAKFGDAGTSLTDGVMGRKVSMFCLFSFVTLFVCANNFAMKALEYRNGFGTLDRKGVYSFSAFNSFSAPLGGTITVC